MIYIKNITFENIKNTYGENNLVKICNLKQILTYAKLNVQPVWIDEGYDNKLIAIYYKDDTTVAWKAWKENNKAIKSALLK